MIHVDDDVYIELMKDGNDSIDWKRQVYWSGCSDLQRNSFENTSPVFVFVSIFVLAHIFIEMIFLKMCQLLEVERY